jgi:tetratricopeptide (TPR) repeat protein
MIPKVKAIKRLENGNTWVAILCSIITVMMLVYNSLIDRHYRAISASIDKFSNMLMEQQTTIAGNSLYEGLVRRYMESKTELEKLVILELMKATNGPLTANFLVWIHQYEQEDTLKNKAVEVLAYKESENISQIRNAKSINEIKVFAQPTPEEKALDRISNENTGNVSNKSIATERVALAARKNLEIARAYYSLNEFEEACNYFNKIDTEGLPDTLVDQSSLILGRKAYTNKDFPKAARNFEFALASIH